MLESLEKEENVFNLSVDEAPEYYANGVLVHNCMATVYWRIGLARFGSNENKIIGGKIDKITESPVIYAGGNMDAQFALDKFKRNKPKADWRKR